MLKQIIQTGKPYPVYIGTGLLARSGNIFTEAIEHLSGKSVVIISDSNVMPLYGSITADSFRSAGCQVYTYEIPAGETSKNWNLLGALLEHLAILQITRSDYLVALGGGVVGDLTGFAASTYMRGIDFIQVPTTLLACVDSSVGGKTAIDTDYGKNLVGTFYQPKAVFINPNFLKTLDERQFKTGLGEVVKYSFIEKSCKCEEDLNLTNFLSEKAEMIVNRDERVLSKLIEICVKLKISVVEKDEKEGGLRRILNFGHTYGHAIEKITKYKKYTHGEAIVEGMKFAFNLAVKRNLIDKNYKFLAEDVIKKFNFVDIPEFDMEKMIELMQMDKKATFDKIVFILPTDYSTVEAFELDSKDLL